MPAYRPAPAERKQISEGLADAIGRTVATIKYANSDECHPRYRDMLLRSIPQENLQLLGLFNQALGGAGGR